MNSFKYSHVRVISILFVVSVWAITFVSKWKFNGLILGFDFGIYQPDGVHYTYKTLTILGYSPVDAAEQVSNWYKEHSYKLTDVDPFLILPENNGAWGLVKTRVMYSILSAPFVLLFGIPGMLVIPALSLLSLMLALLVMAKGTNQIIIACVIIFLISISPTVTRWMLVNCTDSLLVAVFSVYLALFLTKSFSLGSQLIFDFGFILLSSLTRFCLPFWLGLSLVLILQKKFSRALSVFVASLVFSVPTLIAGGNSAFLPANQETSLASKITLIPYNFGRIAFYEIAQLAVLDRGLLMLIALALFISVRYYSELTSQIFLTFLVAGLLVGAINGTIGVNFRYQLPVLFPIGVVLINASTRILRNSISSGKT
jgi:hypothetical protein